MFLASNGQAGIEEVVLAERERGAGDERIDIGGEPMTKRATATAGEHTPEQPVPADAHRKRVAASAERVMRKHRNVFAALAK